MQSAKLHQQNIPVHANAWGITEKIKTTLAGLLTMAAIAVVAAYLFVSISSAYTNETVIWLFVLLFLLGSIAHVFVFPKWLPHLHDAGSFIYMLFLSSIISLVVFIVFIATSFNGGLLPFSVGAAFMLPYAVHQCWLYYAALNPPQVYKAWHMPTDMQPETKASLSLNSLLFSIKIKMKASDREALVFKMALTGRLEVGKMFCRFLYSQQGAVDVTGNHATEYGWRFYVKKWYGLKPLNPGVSLIKNGVKENEEIIIERVIRF